MKFKYTSTNDGDPPITISRLLGPKSITIEAEKYQRAEIGTTNRINCHHL